MEIQRKLTRKSVLYYNTAKGYGYEKPELQILKETIYHRDYLANLNTSCLRLEKLKLFNSHALQHQHFVAIELNK